MAIQLLVNRILEDKIFQLRDELIDEESFFAMKYVENIRRFGSKILAEGGNG